MSWHKNNDQKSWQKKLEDQNLLKFFRESKNNIRDIHKSKNLFNPNSYLSSKCIFINLITFWLMQKVIMKIEKER